MAAWAMILGMLTLVNVTMVGALMQLAGNIPDDPLLVILSRYLRKKGEPENAVLHPMEACSRLQRIRHRVMIAAAVSAATALGLTVAAVFAGWGAVAVAAVTLWIVAANVAFLDIPLASLARRSRRMDAEG